MAATASDSTIATFNAEREDRAIANLREIAYGAKLGRARKVARERFDAALEIEVGFDIPRRRVQDGSRAQFVAYGSVEEDGREYRVVVWEYAGGRLETGLWLLDGKHRQDQGERVKPHLRAAAVARYLEVRKAQRQAKRAEVLAAEAAAESQPTADEREEAAWAAWVVAGGPEKATAEHEAAARASLQDLEADGWTTLSAELKREAFADVATIEAVLRKADRAVVVKWNTFNRGWMEKGPNGSTIFQPTPRARPIDPTVAGVEF